MNNDGTPVFNDEISLKMPKKKQDTTINPAMVFEGYKAPPETEKQKVAYRKMAKKNPPKKDKYKSDS